MIGAVTSARYACFALSRLSFTDFPLEFPSGVAHCPDTTTALVVLNLAASNPMENRGCVLCRSLTIWTLPLVYVISSLYFSTGIDTAYQDAYLSLACVYPTAVSSILLCPHLVSPLPFLSLPHCQCQSTHKGPHIVGEEDTSCYHKHRYCNFPLSLCCIRGGSSPSHYS